MRNQKGFTIIELVIVLVFLFVAAVVLGLVIAAGIYAYKHVTNEAAPAAINAGK